MKVITSGKRILIVSLIVVLIAAASVYGMQVLTSVSQATPVTSVATWDQFELKLEVNKVEFAAGEPVEIKVSLTNTGNETAELIFSAKNQKTLYQILDGNGTLVFMLSAGGLQATEKITLRSGEQISVTDAWERNSNMGNYDNASPVPSGTYTVVGMTGRFFYKDIFPSTWIETQPIVITIE